MKPDAEDNSGKLEMSRFKRVVRGTGIILLALGSALVVWYQGNYITPLLPPPARRLPSPNGYDTFQQAMVIGTLPEEDLRSFNLSRRSSAEQQKLRTLSQRCLAKTREALGQKFLVPQAELGKIASRSSLAYEPHLSMLLFAARASAEQGNLPESMRCALDAIELGVMLPRGGEFLTALAGQDYEWRGHLSATLLADRVDAKTARAAVARLERIEERRWPLAENLREDFRITYPARVLPSFKDGPLSVWEELAPSLPGQPTRSERPLYRADSASEDSPFLPTTPTLWDRVRVVYYGPKAVTDSWESCIKQAQERARLPWGSQRPELPRPENSWNTDSLYRYPNLEFNRYFNRTQSALLRTHLALRAYWQEHKGTYPMMLDTLAAEGYMKAVPIDPFSPTCAPLSYRLTGKTFTLWSVGPDAINNNALPLRSIHWEPDKYPPGDIVESIHTN
ncbi:MAG: hypothetical protein QM758_07225 [Armatimonas sp.]